jgi:excisionase family DNA binding protein
MQQIQFIQITPEQLQDAIITGVKEQIEGLKKSFQPRNPTEYLTRNEVKELLQIDLSTVHNWTKKGKLKAYGIGNRIYYKRSEIENSIIAIN